MELGGGRYVVRRLLGKGGQKTVYLVHDTALDRECAFAWIEAEKLEPADVERIKREAQALAKMGGHPHVVTVFDIGDEGGRPFIVSEYVAGGDLSAELDRAKGPLKISRALAIVADLLDALAAVHDHGIVHRDLKPSNVWIDARGRAKLGDFGLALRSDRSRITESGMVTGTPAYVSPEQLQNLPMDGRSDLYSLGCMLYELVTGQAPFAGSMLAMITQHMHAKPVAPSALNRDVSPELDRLILRLMAKAPDDRFAGARETRGVVDAILEEGPPPLHAQVTHPLPEIPGDEIAQTAARPPSQEQEITAGPPAMISAPLPSSPHPPRLLWIALLLAICAGALAVSLRGWRDRDEAQSAASPIPEAAKLHALGDRLWRTHSLVKATDAWARAIALDPELAPALLRLALENVARQQDTLTARQRYRSASAAAQRLDARERALLQASAPMFGSTSDAVAWRAALQDLAERYPNDGEILYWKAHAELLMGERETARRTAQAAIAADPEFLQPYTLEWSIAEDVGEDPLPLMRRCAERFPQSGSCAGALVWLAMTGTACEQLDALSRAYAAAVPDHFIGDRARAMAFHARGSPNEAVAELLRRAAQRMSPEARDLYGTLMAELAIAGGDLITAERERRADLDRLTALADAGPRALAVARLADVLWELGRADEARALVRDFLLREEALEAPLSGTSFQRIDGRAELLELARRIEAIAKEDFERRKRKLLEAKMPPTRAEVVRALLVSTPEEATSISTRFDAYEGGVTLLLRARARLLAGNRDDGIAILRQALMRCDRLTWALAVPRTRLLIGTLLEEAGDARGAAAEYQAVVAQWGSARPRSITAEEAQRRLAAFPSVQ